MISSKQVSSIFFAAALASAVGLGFGYLVVQESPRDAADLNEFGPRVREIPVDIVDVIGRAEVIVRASNAALIEVGAFAGYDENGNQLSVSEYNDRLMGGDEFQPFDGISYRDYLIDISDVIYRDPNVVLGEQLVVRIAGDYLSDEEMLSYPSEAVWLLFLSASPDEKTFGYVYGEYGGLLLYDGTHFHQNRNSPSLRFLAQVDSGIGPEDTIEWIRRLANLPPES